MDWVFAPQHRRKQFVCGCTCSPLLWFVFRFWFLALSFLIVLFWDRMSTRELLWSSVSRFCFCCYCYLRMSWDMSMYWSREALLPKLLLSKDSSGSIRLPIADWLKIVGACCWNFLPTMLGAWLLPAVTVEFSFGISVIVLSGFLVRELLTVWLSRVWFSCELSPSCLWWVSWS